MRLFFGLSLPDDIRLITGRLAREAAASVPGRYAPPENHHLTLAFVGEVPPERAACAQEVLSRCAARFPAPRVTIDGYGHFGRTQNAILILRAHSGPALGPLHDALVDALRREGLPFDPGPFSPHITLARHACLDGPLPPVPPPVAFTAPAAHLFLSARDARGTLRYTPLFAAPFAPFP